MFYFVVFTFSSINMDSSKMKSGFRVNNILLIDSQFHRENHLEFGDGVSGNMDIRTDVSVQDNKLITVMETVTVKQYHNDKEQVSITVKMAGVFESIGETQIKDYDEFGRVNAAAIIFPYIREHISSLSAKAGIGMIILPPVNFAASKKDKQ